MDLGIGVKEECHVKTLNTTYGSFRVSYCGLEYLGVYIRVPNLGKLPHMSVCGATDNRFAHLHLPVQALYPEP